MRVYQGKNKLTLSEIMNEAQVEMVIDTSKASDCEFDFTENHTKCTIKGNIPKFIKVWNES